MTVEELLSRVSSRELTEWAVFEREYGPLGSLRGDYQAALVATVVASMSGGKSRPKLKDFLLSWGRRKAQSPEEQLAVFAGMGGSSGDDRESSHQVKRGHEGRRPGA